MNEDEDDGEDEQIMHEPGLGFTFSLPSGDIAWPHRDYFRLPKVTCFSFFMETPDF